MRLKLSSLLLFFVITCCAVTTTAQTAKTRVIDSIVDLSGNPRQGTVTFILTKPTTTPAGIAPASASVSAVTNTAGQFDISVYPSTGITPQQYYQVWFADKRTLSRELIGVFEIPVSSTVITLAPYKVTDTNLAAQYTFASTTAVTALTNAVATATLTSLLGISPADGKLQKYDAATGKLKDSAVTDTGSAITLGRDTTISGNTTINGNLTLSGSLSASSGTTLASPTITGTATMNTVNASGTVTAGSFVGNGSGLTGVVAAGTGGSSSTGTLTLKADSNNTGSNQIIDFYLGNTRYMRLSGGLLSGSAVDVIAGHVNVKDYGAKGDGTTNDTAAIQSALNAAAAVATPTSSAILYFPPGIYKITSTVTKSFTSLQSNIIFRGAGSQTQIQFAVGTTATGLSLSSLHSVLFKDLVFTGVYGTSIGRGIYLDTVLQATFENVHFYGVNSYGVSYGGAVVANNSRLTLRDSSFRGCSGDSLNNTGNVTLTSWRDLNVDNVEFIDFGTINGVTYSTSTSPDGWIRLGNVLPVTNSYSGGHALIRNVVADEGAASTLRAYTDDGSQIQSLEIDGWRTNNGSQQGFWLNGIRSVVIRNSQVAYQPSVVSDGFPAVLATNVETLEVENSRFLYNSNSISIGAGCKYARIANSTYKYLSNTGGALVEEVKNGKKVTSFFASSSQPSMPSSADTGILYQDSTTGKLRGSFNGSPFIDMFGGSFATALTDDFTSGAIDTAKWNLIDSGPIVSYSQTGGQLVMTLAPGTAGDDAVAYESVNTYDFTKAGAASVQLTSHTAIGGGGPYFAETFTVKLDSNNYYQFLYDISGFHWNTRVGGVDEGDYITAVSITDAVYWRIRYDAGTDTVKWETSSDGATWTQVASRPRGFALSAVKLEMRVRGFNTSTVTSSTKWDNFRFTQFYTPAITDDGKTVRVSTDALYTTSSIGPILKSPGGTCYRIKTDDSGALSTQSVTCP